MRSLSRLAAVALVACVACFALSSHRVEARTFRHSATFFFRDVTIGTNDVVNGNLNVIFGNFGVLTGLPLGTVHGDLNVVGGSCDYRRWRQQLVQRDGRRSSQPRCVQKRHPRSAPHWRPG